MKNFEPIAIVGIGCRFPGDANNADAYWELLINGVDAISEVPESRWNLRSHYNEDKTKLGKTYTRCGGFLKDIDQFDAEFFGISPREAACMDPQQRILLETTWEAFADAGIDVDQLAGSSVGTFMGIFTHDYNNMQLDTNNRELIDSHTGVGVSTSIVANRISYTYDFTGPSLTLDTACSSSLVALHLACQSIQNGESSLAIAGGANALLKPEFTIATSKASMLSPDGRCKSFDASANGYVRSEGAGVVVLKPLSAAQRDGDSIYAVIKGTVVNQDGRSNGITVPNQESQKAALRNVLEMANVAAEDISYAEAHGTGTFVGDPIEANSIGSILGKHRSSDLIMGSVKSNIGHLEAASGMASLIKVALSLKNEQIPPNLHFNNPNPQIKFEKYHLRVPTAPESWPASPQQPRHACLNSFGFGGTNATVILAEPTPAASNNGAQAPSSTYILPLSADSEPALKSLVGRYRDQLESGTDSLSDLCFSAATRTTHRNQRLAMVASSKDEFLSLAAQYLDGNESPLIARGNKQLSGGKLAFVFSGMGTQWWAMGRQLLQENAIFREVIETCDRLLSEYTDWSLLEELQRSEEDSRINITQYAQPAIFATEIALAKVWESFGIVPDLVCGHSVGEIAAAYISGALSLEDAVKVIYYRSLLQQKTAGMGGMLAVAVSKNNAAHLIASYEGRIAIAAVNSPSSVTLAGEMSSLKRLEQELTADKIFCRLLKVEVPFHCAVMDMIQDELIEALQSIRPRETTLPLYSTVTGGLISGLELNADYWWKNVREPVEFAKTIRAMEDSSVFLEVSPHTALIQSIRESLGSKKQTLVLGSIKRKQDEATTMAATLGSLYVQGYPLDWTRITQGKFVKLPAYPWQRQSHWQESELSRQDRIGTMARRTLLLESAHPLLGNQMELAQQDSIWESEVSPEELTFLEGHKIHGSIVFPGAGFIEMALAATFKPGRATAVLENFSLEKALVLKEQAVKIQSVHSADTFSIYSKESPTSNTWNRHATAKTTHAAQPSEQGHDFDLAAIRARCTTTQSKEALYQRFTNMGFNYAGEFSGIESFDHNQTEALARITLGMQDDPAYKVFPPLLDNGFQALLGIISCNGDESVENRVFLPMQISKIVAYHHAGSEVSEAWCHAQITESTEQGLKGDLQIYDNKGKILISIEGLYCISVDQSRWESLTQEAEQNERLNECYQVNWSPLEAGLLPTNEVSVPQQWIIYGDDQGCASELIQQLENEGHVTIQLSAKSNDAKDIEAALNAVDALENTAGIVYLSPLEIQPLNQTTDPTCGCGDLLTFVQALNHLKLEQPLWVVTQGAQFIYPESSRIEQSPIWGFTQVIALEQPQLPCRCLDLDPDASRSENVSFIRQCLSADTEEDKLALRNGQAHIARLVPSPFTINANAGSDPTHVISPEHSYLITGAFGGLGRLVTQRLIDNGARHLVLMGRRGAQGNEAYIEALSDAGIHVSAAAGDVSNKADVDRIIQEINESTAPLRGIVHAAGVLDDGVISQQTPERFKNIMAPKVQGSWNLHEATLDTPLDFFVCFSSIASLIGSPGQSNYAAGNAFMDALAPIRQSMGLAATSINWGPWQGDGMAAAQLKRLASKGFDAIEQERGLLAFEQLLGQQDIAQIGVSPIEWPSFFAAFPESKSRFFAEFFADSANEDANNDSFLQQLELAVSGDKSELLLQHVEGVVNAVFGFDSSKATDRQRSLFDNGLDSLMALEIKNRLESGLQIVLPSTLLFEHPNIEALGTYLSQEMGIESTSAEPVESEDDKLLKELESMSDEELSALLENELNNG